MIWVLLFIFSNYVFLIFSLTVGFSKMEDFTFKKGNSKTKFSIIIPFRNEALYLPQLLNSISRINYPKDKFEILLVDDESTDTSVAIIQTFIKKTANTNTHVITNQRSSNSPKKDAIATAISKTKFDWIITTDADCSLPNNWLDVFDAFIQEKQPKMVVAPVSYAVKSSFLEQFQLLDFYSLQAATIGGFGIQQPFLCNGANLGYQKSEFLALNGFEGNDEIASGDDIFLFEKFIQKDKKSVHFLKSKKAIVKTFPVKNWRALFHQRVRWAAKSSHYNLAVTKLIGLIVFLANLSLVVTTFLFFFNKIDVLLVVASWVTKILIDFMLLQKILHFFEEKKTIFWYGLSSLLYPFFSFFVAVTSIVTNYSWKGRSFKK